MEKYSRWQFTLFFHFIIGMQMMNDHKWLELIKTNAKQSMYRNARLSEQITSIHF